MLDRKEPFRKIRVAERICVLLEKKQARERYRGPFTRFCEGILEQIAEDLYVPDGTVKIDRVILLQQQILELLKRPAGERVQVQGYRPKKEPNEQSNRKFA